MATPPPWIQSIEESDQLEAILKAAEARTTPKPIPQYRYWFVLNLSRELRRLVGLARISPFQSSAGIGAWIGTISIDLRNDVIK